MIHFLPTYVVNALTHWKGHLGSEVIKCFWHYILAVLGGWPLPNQIRTLVVCWHCHTTSHSATPHPMNRAMRWYTVVTLLYDLCYFIYLFALVIGLAIFDYNWDGWEQIMNIPTTLQHSIFIFYQSLSFFLESFSITCVDSFPKWRVLPIFFLKNGPIPASFCLFSSFQHDTNQYKLIKA